MVSINIKIDELNPDQLADELAGSGGSSFALGVLDDLIKGIRRIGVPALQSGGVFTS